MSYLDLNENRLYYAVEGEGRPVVLIHDGLCHSEVWDGVWNAFSEKFKVVRYDRRGYGKSDAPTESYLETHSVPSNDSSLYPFS